MTSFEPELGQAAFSNTQWQSFDLAPMIRAGIEALDLIIADDDYDRLHIDNRGTEPFENDVFVIRSYCWCDGGKPGHEEGCPPNFEHKKTGFQACWYKHIGRGASQNQRLNRSGPAWRYILMDCLRSLEP